MPGEVTPLRIEIPQAELDDLGPGHGDRERRIRRAPQHSQAFNPDVYENICTGGYVGTP